MVTRTVFPGWAATAALAALFAIQPISFAQDLEAGASASERATEASFIPRYAAGNLYYLWSSEADFKGISGASLQLQEAGIRVPVPLYANDKVRLVSGLRYRWNQIDLDSFGSFNSRLDLHRLQIPVDLWYRINDRWRVWTRVEPGIFSDFNNVSSDDFTISGLALAAYEWNDELSLAFGGYYSRDLGEDRLLPAVGVIWRPDPRWSLSLTMPRFDISYSPVQDTVISLKGQPGGGGWNIEDPAGGSDVDFNYSNIRVGLGVESKLTGKLWGYFEGGYQLNQNVELNGGREQDLEESWYLSGGLRLRF